MRSCIWDATALGGLQWAPRLAHTCLVAASSPWLQQGAKGGPGAYQTCIRAPAPPLVRPAPPIKRAFPASEPGPGSRPATGSGGESARFQARLHAAVNHDRSHVAPVFVIALRRPGGNSPPSSCRLGFRAHCSRLATTYIRTTSQPSRIQSAALPSRRRTLLLPRGFLKSNRPPRRPSPLADSCKIAEIFPARLAAAADQDGHCSRGSS